MAHDSPDATRPLEFQGVAYIEVMANVDRPGTVDAKMPAYISGQEPDQVTGGLTKCFRRMRTDGTLVTAEASAESLMALLAGLVNGAAWSFGGSDTTLDPSSTTKA